MVKPKSPTPENIADGLTARERVILFCAAMNIDHVAVGILASAMQFMEIRGLIERDHNTSRYFSRTLGMPCFAPCLSGPTFRPRRMIVPDIVPTAPEVIPQIVPTAPEVIPQIVPRRRSEQQTMVGCRYVRTLHTTLHMARRPRPVRPHRRGPQSPGPLQHSPDRYHQRREVNQ